jgi:Pectinacetylesterase
MHHHPPRPRPPSTKRPLTVTLAALTVADLLAACSNDDGSGAGATTTTSAAATTTSAATSTAAAATTSTPDLSAEEQAEFETESQVAQCMRDHGIADHPDPQVSGSGVMMVGVPWGQDAEQWNAAREACQHIYDDAAPPDETGAAAGWEKVVPGGDCECADGGEFAFWERRADPTKVVFFLDGGGACYDATTCAFLPDDPAYDWNVRGDDPSRDGGIFDFERADNPFLDYSFILVPSCTGDAHLGDVTREYTPELTVEHNGFVNGTAALSYLAENYPDSAQVVVVGKSIGSIAAPVYGGLAADLLPDAHVTVFGAQLGHVPDDPDLNAEFFGELWGAYDNMPDWDVNEGLTARDWGAPRFWIQAGLHDPEIVMARFDYAYDQEAAQGAESLGLDPSELLAVIDANEAAIEDAGVVQHSYTAPGDGHGILEWPQFYELEVNGVRLVDWVAALIAGQPLDDVHCAECEPG